MPGLGFCGPCYGSDDVIPEGCAGQQAFYLEGIEIVLFGHLQGEFFVLGGLLLGMGTRHRGQGEGEKEQQSGYGSHDRLCWQ